MEVNFNHTHVNERRSERIDYSSKHFGETFDNRQKPIIMNQNSMKNVDSEETKRNKSYKELEGVKERSSHRIPYIGQSRTNLGQDNDIKEKKDERYEAVRDIYESNGYSERYMSETKNELRDYLNSRKQTPYNSTQNLKSRKQSLHERDEEDNIRSNKLIDVESEVHALHKIGSQRSKVSNIKSENVNIESFKKKYAPGYQNLTNKDNSNLQSNVNKIMSNKHSRHSSQKDLKQPETELPRRENIPKKEERIDVRKEVSLPSTDFDNVHTNTNKHTKVS